MRKIIALFVALAVFSSAALWRIALIPLVKKDIAAGYTRIAWIKQDDQRRFSTPRIDSPATLQNYIMKLSILQAQILFFNAFPLHIGLMTLL